MLISSVSYLSVGSEGVDSIFIPLYISGFLMSYVYFQSVISLWVLKGCWFLHIGICLLVLKELLASSVRYLSLGSKGVTCISNQLYVSGF